MNELDKFNRYTGSKEDIRTGFGGDWTEHKVGRGQAIDRYYGRGGTRDENLDYSRALMNDLEWLIMGKEGRDAYPDQGISDDAEFREKGAKYLKGIVERFRPNQENEFYGLLSNMEDVYKSYGDEDMDWEKYAKSKEAMQVFLQENLISPMEPMEIRRMEDKVMDDFIQQDNKYNMGE